MDKNIYLKKVKQRLTDEYLERINELDRCFKSDNVMVTVYIEKKVFEHLDFKVSNGDLELDLYDLKTLLRGKLLMPSITGKDRGYVTQWFVDKCPKCGCYLYYPNHDIDYGVISVCANCFEVRTVERDKAVNFPTEWSGQLVNYKFYTVAGNMDRSELEEFMKELGVGKYGNEVLRGISKDLKRLELGDGIEDTSARDEVEGTMNKLFGNIWDGLYQDEHFGEDK